MLGLLLGSSPLWRKPQPGTPINWNDPLTVGLVSCMLLNDGTNGSPYDMLTGAWGTVTGTVTNAVTDQDSALTGLTPCKHFDGSTGWISWPFTDNGYYDIETPPYSVETWVYPDALASNPRIVARNSSSTVIWYLDIETSGADALRFYVNYSSGTNTDAKAETTAQVPAIGVWTHIVATIGSDAVPHLFVNGAEVTYSSQVTGNLNPVTSSSVVLSVGAKSGTAANFFDGKIGLVRIWRGREFTETEARTLYHDPWRMFRSGYRLPAGFISGIATRTADAALAVVASSSRLFKPNKTAAAATVLTAAGGRIYKPVRTASGALAATAVAARVRTVIRAASAVTALVATTTKLIKKQATAVAAVVANTAGQRLCTRTASGALAATATAARVLKAVRVASAAAALIATTKKLIKKQATAAAAVVASAVGAKLFTRVATGALAVTAATARVFKAVRPASAVTTLIATTKKCVGKRAQAMTSIVATASATKRFIRTAAATLSATAGAGRRGLFKRIASAVATVLAAAGVEGAAATGLWCEVVLLSESDLKTPITDVAWNDANLLVKSQGESSLVETLTLRSDNWVEVGGCVYRVLFETVPDEGLFLYWAAYPNAVVWTGAETLHLAAPHKGAKRYEFRVTDDVGSPIPNCRVWVSTDADGWRVIAGPHLTNADGKTIWFLDAGNYWFWMQKVGYTFNPVNEDVT